MTSSGNVVTVLEDRKEIGIVFDVQEVRHLVCRARRWSLYESGSVRSAGRHRP
ncbi:hypothetical protein DICSQDRAFT_139162 [Dichomitus squalens LYAD-421 SS1]|uniref:Uncharacterized protein n=1 Tax=Dichomitus squalens (strain LYAD-421) TaxID=732165 RepID=R7SSN3_DICSQ|nr:uncharacterized protein DICSQDRAFT_139162 [Dichomitus squalens LYAD-421 SS1]EJF58720.1 hypothetical protein DICSQDRAFT_139162 [Dichomitus squalens LYAD-421 SS1]